MVTMQCCSEFDQETRELVKDLLTLYFKNVSFTKTFIPSFCENWIFAAAQAG